MKQKFLLSNFLAAFFCLAATRMCGLRSTIFPYSENFQGTTGTALPSGWTQTTLSTDGGWLSGDNSSLSSSFWTIPAHTKFVATNDDACDCNKSADRLISPAFNLSSLTNGKLSFSYYHTTDFGGQASFQVSTNGGTTWTTVGTVLAPGNTWQDYEIFLTPYASQTNIKFAVLYNDLTEWATGIAFDDFKIEAGPSCPSPTALTATAAATTASLNWTENGTATSWDIEAGPAGFTQGGFTSLGVVTTSAEPYTLTGLSALTNYEY